MNETLMQFGPDSAPPPTIHHINDLGFTAARIIGLHQTLSINRVYQTLTA